MHTTRAFVTESSSLQNPSSEKRSLKQCCHFGNSDGFTIITICFLVFTIAVTCALIFQIHFGSPELAPHGAVASDDQTCSEVGIHIIQEGGSSVDATIASLLCLSVVFPHLVGPGGGGIMLIHDHKRNQSRIFDFMLSFPTVHDTVGIPGFLRGIEKLHKLFGNLSWVTLFKPAITLAMNGFFVSKQLSEVLTSSRGRLSRSMLAEFFPKGVALREGQVMKRRKYARFLSDVAKGGADEFYLFRHGVEFMDIMKPHSSRLPVHELRHYKVIERPVLTLNLNNVTLVTGNFPSGGAATEAALRQLADGGVDAQTHLDVLYEEIMGALLRGTELIVERNGTENAIADVDFLSPLAVAASRSSPAAQVSVVDTYDLYVAAIVGLGSPFGAGQMTEHGVILNSFPLLHERSSSFEVDANANESSTWDGRRFTPYTPLVAFDTHRVCGRRVVLSSSSWSALAQVGAHLVLRGLDMIAAVAEPRVAVESSSTLLLNDFDPEVNRLSRNVRAYLTSRNISLSGHFTSQPVNGVSKLGDDLVSHADPLSGGVAARLTHRDNEKSKGSLVSPVNDANIIS